MKTFIIEQKITLFTNYYKVYSTGKDGKKDQLVAFTRQKPLTLKEAFTFYTDEKMTNILFSVKARQVIDFGARYDVTDAEGRPLGTIGKAFKASLLRSTWHMYQPGQQKTPLIKAQERSSDLALLRRVWGMIPIIGEIPFVFKYHFDFFDTESGLLLATYNKTTTLRDHYRLDIQEELLDKIDWRTVVSLGIMMDALQGR